MEDLKIAPAEPMDPTVENTHWEQNFRSRNYVDAKDPYAAYQDAYRYGWESKAQQPEGKWNEVEADLAKGWEAAKGKSVLAWEQAKAATKDAWYRVEKAARPAQPRPNTQ